MVTISPMVLACVILSAYLYGMIVPKICQELVVPSSGMRIRDWVGTILLGWFLVPIAVLTALMVVFIQNISKITSAIKKHW